MCSHQCMDIWRVSSLGKGERGCFILSFGTDKIYILSVVVKSPFLCSLFRNVLHVFWRSSGPALRHLWTSFPCQCCCMFVCGTLCSWEPGGRPPISMFSCFSRFVRAAESAGEEAGPVGRRRGWVSDDCFQWLPAGHEGCQAQRHEGGGNWCAKSKWFCAVLWQHCQGHEKRGISWSGSLRLLVNVMHHLSVWLFVYLFIIVKNHLQNGS